ncbi:hypothetical protein F4810DRAFT_692437 [Camillea tinctor]|nr:hypothetical protein F4810DRAFT_692437 [Camillea tinctor]
MATCIIEGNADMYGLGIRLGFYLNWFAGILANVVAVSEIETSRYAFSCFITATFVALIVQTAQAAALTVVDIYVVLLLCFGYFYFLVPTFFWRLLTGFDAALDPTRWPSGSRAGTLHHVVHSLLLLAVAAFQLWFWITVTPSADKGGCTYYGFLFARFDIANVTFRSVNIAFQALIILICLAILGGHVLGTRRGKRETDTSTSPSRKALLRSSHAILLLAVAAIVTTATEMTIAWNGITGVTGLDSAGQLIPFLIGLGVLGRVLYVAVRVSGGEDGVSSATAAADNQQKPVHALYMPIPAAAQPPPMLPVDPWTMPMAQAPYYYSGSDGRQRS